MKHGSELVIMVLQQCKVALISKDKLSESHREIHNYGNHPTLQNIQHIKSTDQSALWANSWIDTWFFVLCLMLSGLGNFVVDCHI